VSNLLHAFVHDFTTLLNVLVQIANKVVNKKKIKKQYVFEWKIIIYFSVCIVMH
jgi:hypothetical protein